MAKKPSNNLSATEDLDTLFKRLAGYLEQARQNVLRTVDTEMVKAYWLVGRDIVEEEQKGKERAGYASYLLTTLSTRLTKQFGKGFGLTTLKYIRRFYLTYSSMGHTLCDQSKESFNPYLSWSHYRLLIQVDRAEARNFYEIEASKNRWSVRELDRQINSLLFERLSKSKDKKGLLQLATKGQEIIRPSDAIKDPVILEFLDIPAHHQLVESKLEEALIGNLQHFLLELGTGFSFIARQKRLTLDGDHFYADLVFYHVVLKCYVIIDLKTRELRHGDLGQMLLYVNYFDREIAVEGDNPTVGLVLCTKKKHEMVKYMLGEDNQTIFASQYQFHLPSEAELENELKREMQLIEQQQIFDKKRS